VNPITTQQLVREHYFENVVMIGLLD